MDASQPVTSTTPAPLGLLRNSLANLVRGFSAGLVALVLPAVLVRVLQRDAYAAWAIILQIAAYVAMLDLGLQVGIGRFVARETARGEHVRREQFFFGGLTLLTGAGVIALLATVLVAGFLPNLFPTIPPSLLAPSRVAVLLIGGSSAVALPGSAIAAVFIGLERFDIPAAVFGLGRLIQVASVSIVATTTRNLTAIALTYAICNVLMQLAFLALLSRRGPRLRYGSGAVNRGILRELVRYCAALSVWTFSMLLISGLDTTIVAEVDYKSVAAYSVCANLLAVFAGFVNSSFNVLISRTSSLDGSGLSHEIGRLLVQASQLCTLGASCIGLGAIWLATPLLNAWIGPSLAATAVPIFVVLVIANGIRLLLVPFASVLMGVGEQRLVNWIVLAEGVVNLGFSIGLGIRLGGIGVAYGTLIGAALSFVLVLAFAFRKMTRVSCSAGDFLRQGILKPLGLSGPFAIGTLYSFLNPGASAILPSLGLGLSLCLLVRFCRPWFVARYNRRRVAA